jgi:proteasome lid subunit RPN8/RPN11
MQNLILTSEQWQTMRNHVNAEAPLEACGLLSGKDSRVESVHQIRNQVQSSARYVMDPIEQLNAFNWIESHNMDLLAIYHSHPTGPENVSATDIEEAAYPVVYIVWSRMRGEWQARAFWIENRKVTDVQMNVI